jgi:L-asparagine transporter-like permease
MQLLEYFAWKYLNNKKINRLLSMLGLFLVLIQPILFILIPNNVKFNVKASLITLYVIFFTCIIISYNSLAITDFSMTKAANGHLAWHWLKNAPYSNLIWLSFFLVILLFIKKYILFTIHLIFFLTIYYTYYKMKPWGLYGVG